MENTNKNFERQILYAQRIEQTKQKEWLGEARKYVPEYAAEYLFYPKTGVLSQMLLVDPEKGFSYDPEVLLSGIETVVQIMKASALPTTNPNRLKHLYSSFADAKTRIEYLRTFIEYLDLYPAVGEEVIADLNEVAKSSSDPEFLEYLEPRIKHIKHQLEQKDSSNKNQREF
ncbi:MAG: hypothetical protein IKJ33_00655 [Clostridia bacterium]|nr:hypothetical protein [Clostridia bacterium]